MVVINVINYSFLWWVCINGISIVLSGIGIMVDFKNDVIVIDLSICLELINCCVFCFNFLVIVIIYF